MRSRLAAWRNYVLAGSAIVLALPAENVHAQVGVAAEGVAAPMTPLPGGQAGAAPQTGPAQTGPAQTGLQTGLFSDLLGVVNERATNAQAPAWLLVPRIGIIEIMSDSSNGGGIGAANRTDLLSILNGGVTLSGDTPRLQVTADYNASYTKSVNLPVLERLSLNGFGTAHTTVVPEYFFVDLRLLANLSDRVGSGVDQTILQSSSTTQMYSGSISPDFRFSVGSLATGDIRYLASRVWFDGATGPLATPGGGAIPGIGNSTQQTLSASLNAAGTIVPDLSTGVVAVANDDQSESFGTLRTATVQATNEYQLNTSLSLIAAGGYESLSNPAYARLNGQGAVWNVGGRWRPNLDSSVVVMYGRQRLNDSFSGEAQYRISEITGLYASYTDSTGSLQQGLGTGGTTGAFGPFGLSNNVGFGQNTTLAQLNQTGGMVSQNFNLAGGSFLGAGSVPLQNGFFRSKSASLSVSHDAPSGDSFNFAVFHSDRTSQTTVSAASFGSYGVQGGWSRPLNDAMSVHASAIYSEQTLTDSKTLNLSGGLSYVLGQGIRLSGQYSFLRANSGFSGGSFTRHAITVNLAKSFN